jgi:hypothetical protein
MEVVTIVSVIIAVFQAIIILYLVGIKTDINAIWARLNNHSHLATCHGDDCRDVRIGNVIINHE